MIVAVNVVLRMFVGDVNQPCPALGEGVAPRFNLKQNSATESSLMWRLYGLIRMNFTAIDFETATRARDSACQLAAVRIRHNEIVNQACWLIRPRPLRFAAGNIAIHGIRPGDVLGEPEFGQLWAEISHVLGDDVLIAHNASFDLGVLLACLQTHDQPIPEIQYSCTRAIARRTWPHLPRFGLKPLSDWLGTRFRHHDALEDSIACAKIAIAASEERRVDTLDELERDLGLHRGHAGAWGKRGVTARPRRRTKRDAIVAPRSDDSTQPVASPTVSIERTDLQRLLVRAELIRPLQGRRVVFTGTLRRLDRQQAEQIAVQSGGACQSRVSKNTNVVVVGDPDARTKAAGRLMSTKEERARELRDQGCDVQIVSEDEFISMVIHFDAEAS